MFILEGHVSRICYNYTRCSLAAGFHIVLHHLWGTEIREIRGSLCLTFKTNIYESSQGKWHCVRQYEWHCTKKVNTTDGDFFYRFKLETPVLLDFWGHVPHNKCQS